jgi:hypothetical protein
MSVSYRTTGLKAAWAWIKTGVSGILFSLLCIIISIWLFTTSDNSNIFKVFGEKTFAVILLTVSIIFIVLYVIAANKIALSTLINLVWNNKLSGFIVTRVHTYMQSFTDSQPDWLTDINKSRFSQMCQDIILRDGTLNKIQRTVLRYGFRHLSLSKSDFQKPQYELSETIVTKISDKISSVTEPSYLFFRILLIIQFIVLVLAVLLN